jgi:hypothetical protein
MKVSLKKEMEVRVLVQKELKWLPGRIFGPPRRIKKKGAPNQGPFYKPPSSST